MFTWMRWLYVKWAWPSLSGTSSALKLKLEISKWKFRTENGMWENVERNSLDNIEIPIGQFCEIVIMCRQVYERCGYLGNFRIRCNGRWMRSNRFAVVILTENKFFKVISNSIQKTDQLTAVHESSKNSPLIALPRFDNKCSQNDQANWSPSLGFVLRYNSSIITKLFAVTFFKMCSVIFTSSTNDDEFFSIESFEPMRVKIRSVTLSSAFFAGM